jgi:hypothetical protein
MLTTISVSFLQELCRRAGCIGRAFGGAHFRGLLHYPSQNSRHEFSARRGCDFDGLFAHGFVGGILLRQHFFVARRVLTGKILNIGRRSLIASW